MIKAEDFRSSEESENRPGGSRQRVPEIINYVDECILDAQKRGRKVVEVPVTRSGWALAEINKAADAYRQHGWNVATGHDSVIMLLWV